MSYQNSNTYLMLFSDCIPVKGYLRSTICDLTRNQIEIIPSEYYDLLQEFKSNKISEIYDNYLEDYHKEIDNFIDFLLGKEFAIQINNIQQFPQIERVWDSPEKINNAIIDIKAKKFGFERIIMELDGLDCQFVQLRLYENLYSLDEISMIINMMVDTSINGVEVIVKYENQNDDDKYVSFFEKNILLTSLHVHSAPETRTLKVNFGYEEDNEEVFLTIAQKIFFVEESIDGANHCGKINKKYFCISDINDFMNNACGNSCLNKKISIDEDGEIKNCPSMSKSYGNIKTKTLDRVFKEKDFKRLWKVTKDDIHVCKYCEFRLVCTDCRAIIEDPKDEYSKPLKCGYDPKTGIWEDWKKKKLKNDATNFHKVNQT